MSKKDATDLLHRYHTGKVTKEEKALVESWYLYYTQHAHIPEIDDQEMDNNQQEGLYKLLSEIKPKHNLNYLWFGGVAAMLLMGLFTIKFFIKHPQRNNGQLSVAHKSVKPDFLPGGNKAILILSNGSSINLTAVKNGKLTSDKGVSIDKNSDGQIAYTHNGNNDKKNAAAYNTIITPRGGRYQLVLSDGTKVWLNSASSLKYPVTFTGTKREVELSGEAYFEVAHDQHKPFRVVSETQAVEVLGTHFNVNAYQDENVVKTTLLEGSVKVLSNGKSSQIKPGEQLQLENGRMTVSEADMEEAIAWKNGFFYFKDDDVKEVMRQFSRWFDVEIKFEGKLPERKFSGQISQKIEASQLLHILTIEKIHYRAENKTIIIIP